MQVMLIFHILGLLLNVIPAMTIVCWTILLLAFICTIYVYHGFVTMHMIHILFKPNQICETEN